MLPPLYRCKDWGPEQGSLCLRSHSSKKQSWDWSWVFMAPGLSFLLPLPGRLRKEERVMLIRAAISWPFLSPLHLRALCIRPHLILRAALKGRCWGCLINSTGRWAKWAQSSGSLTQSHSFLMGTVLLFFPWIPVWFCALLIEEEKPFLPRLEGQGETSLAIEWREQQRAKVWKLEPAWPVGGAAQQTMLLGQCDWGAEG